MDYLPIQSSAVPYEHIFSSNADTDMCKHNQINPILMEALQMLKFALKKKCLNFTCGMFTKPSGLTKDDPKELQYNARLSSEEQFDRLVKQATSEDGPDGDNGSDDNVVEIFSLPE